MATSNSNGHGDHKSYEMREDLDQAGKISDPLIANPATQAIPAKAVSCPGCHCCMVVLC